ncbi:MAG: hypothetical protein ABW167_07765 [Baekduia sp.]
MKGRPILTMLLLAGILCGLGAAGVGGVWTTGAGLLLCVAAFGLMVGTDWK